MKRKLTRKPIQLGFLHIPKSKAHLFPSKKDSVKIVVIFDDRNKVELTYNSKYRRLHGLTEFYRKHNAKPGDNVRVEVLELGEKYKISFEKSTEYIPFLEPLRKKKTEVLVGPPINFRGLMYAPVNENGVIFLFSKLSEDISIAVEGIQVKFPDAFGKRYENNKGYPITIEFEYKSSDYKRHGHPKEGCDLIVCWKHDWEQCPIQVIELRSLIEKLSKK